MKRYFELFFRHWLLFSLPMVVALVVGVGYASKAARTYTSSATMFCDASLPNPSTLVQGVSPGNVTPSADKLSALQEFLGTQSFVDKVALRSPLAPFLKTHSQLVDQLAADAMAKTISTSTTGPHILDITVKAASPAMAAGTVRAVIDEFTAELGAVLKDRAIAVAGASQAGVDASNRALAQAKTPGELALAQQQAQTAVNNFNQAQLGITGAVDPTSFHVVDPPQTPTAPNSRKKQLMMSGVGGLLGGAVISILALILLMAQDRSVRDEQDVEAALDLEVFASVAQFDKVGRSPRRLRRQKEPQEWFWTPPGLVESCTLALQRLERAEVGPAPLPRAGLRVTRKAPVTGRGPGGPSRTIGVTSCLHGEGRSTIATGMAVAVCQSLGLRAILVELDLERPSLARRLGIDPGPGVAEILRNGASIQECLHMPHDGSPGAVVAGEIGGDVAGLFARLRTSSLVSELGGLCDVVIADLPPLSPIGQAASLAPLCSSVLLVVRSGTAAVSQISRAVADLDGPPPIILNGVESSIPRPLRSLLAG